MDIVINMMNMPYKTPEARKAWRRLYMKDYRRGERRTRNTRSVTPARLNRVTPCVTPVTPTHAEAPKSAQALPKAIYNTIKLTRTHRFEIRANYSTPISPVALAKVTVKRRGKEGRIVFGEVVLANSVIEFHKRAVRIYSTRELDGLDPEQIQGMKDALAHACRFRGIRIEQEAKWHIGEHSHTTMEDEALNDALTPLGIKNVGDNNYNIFKDDGSHPDQVETAGKENWSGTNLLYHILFQLPLDNAEAFRKYGENIDLHLEAIKELRDAVRDLRKVLEKR